MRTKEQFADAIYEGDLASVSEALDAGADPNASYEERTMLVWAIQQGQREIVQTLLSRGALASLGGQDGFTPLYQASAEGRLDYIEMLIAAGAGVNQVTPHGSALLLACAYEHLEVVRLLMAHGANPEAANSDGDTPLSMARSYGNQELLALLGAGEKG